MQDAWAVVGLGNPGEKYRNTRHNAGFLAIDRLSRELGVELSWEQKFESLVARGTLAEQTIVVCQPHTFMNASGKAVGKLLRFHKIEIQRLIVVVDDADLELGMVRLRPKGSSGGHNGLKSISSVIGTDDYARLRVGIGRRAGGELHQHVLGRFSTREQDLVERVLDRVNDQVYTVLTEGLEKAMNRYNGLVS